MILLLTIRKETDWVRPHSQHLEGAGMLRASCKQVKLNVYLPPNPDALSIHASYTFISHSQGLAARSSQILTSQSSSEQQVDIRMDLEEGPALDYGDYTSEVHKPHFEVEAEVATMKKRICTAGGRGDYIHDTICRNCYSGTPHFHCKDCFGTELYCHTCVVTMHAKTPVHRVQEWTGLYFVPVSLKKLGLCVQLGHPAGEFCLLPQKVVNDDFTLIDSNGIHEIGLDFCGCKTAKRHTKQLLRITWFPATSTNPRTAATFQILEQYHLLSFESKVSGYEFYHSLARMTDNTRLRPQKDRYKAFMQIRAGRGHDPAGVENTGNGECAVICPACPQPSRNLPDNWEEAPKETRWLYGLFLAIDANFRLKRRMVSKDSADPGLGNGWAYFVEETAYKRYLQSHNGTLQQKSTCSSHNAVNMADTKVSQGLAATGVGTIDCARHNMKLPNSVGDLQKGEKYTNMDNLFFSTLRGHAISTLNISYDIACQWHKHLWERMSVMSPELHLDHAAKFIRFFMPKFHLPAHVLKCQTMFSFNFSRNVGRTDGEAPERGWSNINPVASSMKAMGPGSRRDTLDDHFGDWNWKKVVGLGNKESKAHQIVFEELHGVLKPETTETWKIEIEDWEDNPNDSSVTNPFEAKVIPITQAAVHLRLAQLEAAELQQGTDVSMHTDVSPSIFIASGIDLESEQRRLKVYRKKQGRHPTDTQLECITSKINTWRHLQILYTPAAQLMESRAESPTSDVIESENSQLWLPSALCSKHKHCNERLLTTEWDLRYAQAGDALEEIRQSLRLQDYMYTFKRDWICGQIANTCAQNALSRVESRAMAAADKYRAALSDLARVLPKDGWDHRYKVLDKKTDVRGIEGRRQLSWIWLVEGVGDDKDEMVQDSLRIEWCKARARSMRWAEEVELLQEEMRWVSCFLKWHATWWKKKIAECTLATAADNEGLSGYACRQAQLREDLTDCFEKKWAGALETMVACEANLDLYLPEIRVP
ncbi:uncharacterized protein F5147DRAFT_748193 [Suillus discolor]|uniref:CxC2-like cysteine cluster KDZ transposase-associated domain-containing protein n=1 Tax=Suillus discolor TaxID=1912936 RepID=A0A9P7EUF9_9AGAM|nr:uncharacterized protein F5147DRAFT_748193 [Suillus discolor]KAG2090914.1 hypothetical protein F5147DRAFT_748193 [Suillus discolor]